MLRSSEIFISALFIAPRTPSGAAPFRRGRYARLVTMRSRHLCCDCLDRRRKRLCTPAKKYQLSGGKWSNRYLCTVAVVILDNSSKRFGAYIAHTLTRASDAPPSRQAQKAPFSVVRKGLISGKAAKNRQKAKKSRRTTFRLDLDLSHSISYCRPIQIA